MKDEIYRSDQEEPHSEPSSAMFDSPFIFNETVAVVFEDMIKRSVPGYGLTLEMIGVVARRVFANQQGGICYDLGCSLGASMLPVLQATGARVIGVDTSLEMLEKASQALDAYKDRIELKNEPMETTSLAGAEMVILNFTLQFLPLELRKQFLKRCYNALEPGGVLVISEKFVSPEQATNETLIDLHHEFKSVQGYSALEIARKRDAIEHVLIPESKETHLERLKEVGFTNPTCWFQCFNFCSFLAEK